MFIQTCSSALHCCDPRSGHSPLTLYRTVAHWMIPGDQQFLIFQPLFYCHSHFHHISSCSDVWDEQCWGKLLLKRMHYLVTLMERNALLFVTWARLAS